MRAHSPVPSFQVVVTPNATNDLFDIVDFIAADVPERAHSFVDDLQSRIFQLLSTQPNGGVRIGADRYLTFGQYVAVYRVVDQEQVVILHMITHGARDWRRLRQERSPVND
jgi:plasmid stabilization system protein ParE